MIYVPPTAKVISRRSQFIVLSERMDYKSSSLTTRPRRLLSLMHFTCKLFSGERFRLIEPLVDTMRLFGIQSPDPVALKGFPGIIRPLATCSMQQRETWVLKLWFCSGNARRQVTSGIFASSNRSDGHSCVHSGHVLFRLRTVCHFVCTSLGE